MTNSKTAAGATQNTTSNNNLNPKTTSYEFLGPPGAFGFVTALPALALFFGACCDATGYPSPLLFEDWREFLGHKLSAEYLKMMFDPRAAGVYFGFVGLLVIFSFVPGGKVVSGTTLRNGRRLKYRLNGLNSFFMLAAVCAFLVYKKGVESMVFVYNHWIGLVTTSILFSYALSLFVYIKSFVPGALLALGGNTGNMLYDYVLGRELNPRIGSFDLKFFTELRPGLIGWVFINISFACKQYVDLGRVTNSMVLVLFFHTWYVLDSLWNEDAILTTMDITTDGFGYMLVFGLYTWVPVVYTLQARYLVDFPNDLSYAAFATIFSLNIIGYYIFRGANSQKNDFRNDPDGPNVKHLKYLKTERGTKLIISGWWGISRHINYLGDWLMAVSWCLPCGFNSAIPYFYAFYFGILLLHRERRDDHQCRMKYGKDWEKYCSIVKYRIFPGIY